MDVATKDPWKPLVRIGWIALGLGVLDVARIPLPLDWPDTVVTFMAGWALVKRRRSALLKTAVAGGVVLGDALVSLPLISGVLLRELQRFDFDPSLSGIVLSRLILYGLQMLFWPLASAAAVCNQDSRGLRSAYADHTRDTVVGAFFLSLWISGVLQALIKIVLFRLV